MFISIIKVISVFSVIPNIKFLSLVLQMSLFLGFEYVVNTQKIYTVHTEKCVNFLKRPCSGFCLS